MSEEEDITEKMNKLSVQSSDIPSYVDKDIAYLAYCYVNNITDFDFSSNMDAMTNPTIEEVVDWYQFYDLLCDLFKGYLDMTKIHNVDDTLVHTYVSYYIEQQQC